MNNFISLKKTLNHCIKALDNSRSLFVENPNTDFLRKRKLDSTTVINNIICMKSGSLKDELLKLNDYYIDTPTASAFVQARDKIKIDAFKSLFNNFNKKTSKLKTYKGYRLLAIDGSEKPDANTFHDKEKTLLRKGKKDMTGTMSHTIRRFLNKKTSGKPPVENLIAKEILPVRSGRTETRQVSAKKSYASTIDLINTCLLYTYEKAVSRLYFFAYIK